MPEAIVTKTCTQCKTEKSDTDFHRRHKECKGCRHKEYLAQKDTPKFKARQARARERYRNGGAKKIYSQAYYSRPEIRLQRSIYQHQRPPVKKTREQSAKIRSNPASKIKRQARDAVKASIKSKILLRPDHCSKCGLICHPHGHHKSYERDRWLDVEWLCVSCHRIAHGKEPALYLRLSMTQLQLASHSG